MHLLDTMEDNSEKNIRNYLLWMIPIILASKIIRWTVLAHQLIGMSIGWGMVWLINGHTYQPFSSNNSIVDNACAIFDNINIFGITTFEGWEIFFTIIYNIILFYIVRAYYRRNPEAGTLENIFIYLNLGVINIFCFTLSKECYQFLFWLLIVALITIPKTMNRKRLGFVIAILISTAFARRYYALILMYFIAIAIYAELFLTNINLATGEGRKKMIWGVILLFVFIGGFHYAFMDILQDTDADTFNELVRVNLREGSRADSEITPIFRGGQFMFTLDFFVKIFRLLFPFELLRNPKPVYLLLIIYQSFVAYFIYRNFMKGRSVDDEEEYYIEDTEIDDELIEETYEEEQENVDTRTMALYIYLSFLICSAGFEPDFGSWLRHESVAFPIIIFMM